MFTGIVEEMGRIERISGAGKALQLTITCKTVLEDVHLGDSIAVNGICLTVTQFNKTSFRADVMPETYRTTSFAALKTGSQVNLERAMPLGGRLGGHLVSGHIDGTGLIVGKREENNALWLDIQADHNIMKYIIMKGSVCLDGTSLTVSALTENTFSVSLIPHTGKTTILSKKEQGDRVNIECDVLAKYVEQLMKPHENQQKGISLEWIKDQGF